MRIAQSDCTQLGVAECGLGSGAMLGAAFWDQQSKFRIRLGPLTHGEFRRFLPNATGFIALARFGNFYAGPSLDFDVQLVIKRSEVPYWYSAATANSPLTSDGRHGCAASRRVTIRTMRRSLLARQGVGGRVSSASMTARSPLKWRSAGARRKHAAWLFDTRMNAQKSGLG